MASVSFDKSRNKWKVYWISSVMGRRGSKSFDTEQQARLYCLQVESTLSSAPDSSVPVANMIAPWVAHCSRYADRTCDQYLAATDLFLEVAGVTFAHEFTASAVELFMQQVQSRGVCNRTVNAYLTGVRCFSAWSSRVYGTPNFAASCPLLPEDPPDQRFLSEEEVSLLLSNGSALFRQRALFLINSGLRASEFCGLMFDRPAKPSGTCGWVESGGTMLCVHGKGRKVRHVPLNQTCREIIASLRDSGSPYIFLSKSGSRLTRYALYHQCQKLAAVIGIPTFGPHAFRHFFATQLLREGVDIASVSKIMGHSSIRTTESVYVHWTPGYLSGLTDCLSVTGSGVQLQDA